MGVEEDIWFEEGRGEGRRLHNEELNELHIIRVIQSRRMRCGGHEACMGRREVHTGKSEGKRPLRETLAYSKG